MLTKWIGFLILRAILASLSIEIQLEPVPEPTAVPAPQYDVYEGIAPHYGISEKTGVDIMIGVAHVNGLPVKECMISTPLLNGPGQENTLGMMVTVESLVTGAVRECQVTDTSQDVNTSGRGDPNESDRERHIRQKKYVEFGWTITPTMCGLSYPGQEPPRACPIRILIPK